MPAYRVNIDGRIFEGHYASKHDAVFGCMIKDQNDRNREVSRHSPKRSDHSPDCMMMRLSYGWNCTCDAWDDYRAAVRDDALLDARPSLIGVELVLDRRVAKKVHRVEQ